MAPIIFKNRERYTKEMIDTLTAQIQELQVAVVEETKEAMEKLLSIELLYEVRDYIDELILNWEDEEVEIEFDDEEDDFDE
jgi:hypothetical protein